MIVKSDGFTLENRPVNGDRANRDKSGQAEEMRQTGLLTTCALLAPCRDNRF
jgi:hypothetical protein